MQIVDLTIPRNSFQRTMLGLDISDLPKPDVDIFSQACVSEFRSITSDRHVHKVAQVFEAGVLQEVAMLEGVDYSSLASLEYLETDELRKLHSLVVRYRDLGIDSLRNVISVLISISRFEVASLLLDEAERRPLAMRDRFEVAMLRFIVSNRHQDGRLSRDAFRVMRECITAERLAPERILDACAQAVVWYLKRKELAEDDYSWFLELGRTTALSEEVDPGAVSSWYRGLAMVPAAKRDIRTTRADMEKAYTAARAALSMRPQAYELHFLKTYYESSLKEHLYVTKELPKAIEAGLSLIQVDPVWSPSYGELAEVYEKFGRYDEAAHYYLRATAIGAPYVCFHLSKAGQAFCSAGNKSAAGECRMLFERLTGGLERNTIRSREAVHE